MLVAEKALIPGEKKEKSPASIVGGKEKRGGEYISRGGAYYPHRRNLSRHRRNFITAKKKLRWLPSKKKERERSRGQTPKGGRNLPP